MYSQRWLLVLICVVTLAGSASAQVEQDAATIADRYLTAMQRKGYAFLSKDELLRRRDQIASFTAKHLGQRLDRRAQRGAYADYRRRLLESRRADRGTAGPLIRRALEEVARIEHQRDLGSSVS